jgi:ATP-dependent DNA ligase
VISAEQLQRRLHVARPAPSLVAAVPVTFIAFDLPWQASRSLLRGPYAKRRALLDGLGLTEEHRCPEDIRATRSRNVVSARICDTRYPPD